MAADIFISFPSKDVKIASTLCSALESRGFSCWIAARDIQPGENFQIAIVRALRRAKIMLLVFTANSNNSEEMAKELALASQQKMMVIPLRIEDVTPNEAFAYEFATRQWIDVFADWETSIDQLCRRIGRALEVQPSDSKLAAKAPVAEAKPPPAAPKPASAGKAAAKPAAEVEPDPPAADGGVPVMSLASLGDALDAESEPDDPLTDDRVPAYVFESPPPPRRRMPVAARIALLAAAFAAVVGVGLTARSTLAAKSQAQSASAPAPAAAAQQGPPAASVLAPVAAENVVAPEVKPLAKQKRKVEEFDLPVEADAPPRKEDIPF